jgi:hypothetical protein
MSRKKVKRVMIFFILFLPLQYALVGVSDSLKSEPWPALVLPAFKNSFGSKKQLFTHQVAFSVKDKKNKKLRELDPAKLFPNIPKSQLSGFLRLHFSDSLKIADFNTQTRKWLRRRVEQLQPAGHPQKLVVKWIKKQYRPGQETPSQSEIENRFTIPLDDE